MTTNLLQPLATLYRVGVATRNILFDLKVLPTYRSTLPVICVGNLTVGGNGKTPFSLYLLAKLQKLGFSPVLLSRGYGGRLKGPVVVATNHTAGDVGDESILYRESLPGVKIVVARDRVAGAKLIEAEKLGDIIVLDDGYQHRYLDRNINLVLFDSQTPGLEQGIVADNLLPLGRLREPAKAALARADGVIIVNKEAREVAYKDLYGCGLPSWEFDLKPKNLTDLFSAKKYDPKDLDVSNISLLTAIAQPQSFVNSLAQIGIVPKRQFIYRDHHNYTLDQWSEVRKQAQGLIVTTAKDGVKLKQLLVKELELLQLNLEGCLREDKEKSFEEWLLSKIQ